MKSAKQVKTGITSTALVIFFMIVSCNVIGEMGSGNVIREERKVDSFDAIDVSGSFDIYLAQGTTQSVIVEADDNLMKLIRTEVRGNKLEIETKRPVIHSKSMKVYLTVTDLKSIDVSGSVYVETQSKLTLADLSISGSGATDGKLEMDVQKLRIDCSGGSKLKLTGTAKEVHVDGSGAIDLFAYDLPAEIYYLDISGAGKAQINVSKEMNVEISGAGTVYYKGNPAKNVQDISGAGSVRKVE